LFSDGATFAIGRKENYQIDGDAFVYVDRNLCVVRHSAHAGGVRSRVVGYPDTIAMDHSEWSVIHL
jgi:hypothetical protein